MKIKNLMTLGLLGMTLAFAPKIASAETDFSVKPIIPQEQKDKDISYYELNTEDKVGKISFEINNKGDEKATFDIIVAEGETNEQGVPFYKKESKSPLVSFPKKIDVEAHSTKTIEGEVNNSAIKNGLKINAITIKESGEQKDSSYVSYSIPVVLKNGKIPNMSVNIGDLSVDYDKNTLAPLLTVPIKNSVNNYESNVVMETKITKDGKDKFSTKTENITLLPNKESKIIVPLNLSSGEYEVDITVKGKDFKEKYNGILVIDKTKINKEKEEKANKKSFSNNELFLIVVIVVLLIALGLVTYKNRKKSE